MLYKAINNNTTKNNTTKKLTNQNTATSQRCLWRCKVLAITKIQSCGREGDYTCNMLSPPEWFCIKHVHTRAKTKCIPVLSAAAVWLWSISCTNYVGQSHMTVSTNQLLTRKISQSWINPGSICLLFFVLLLLLFFFIYFIVPCRKSGLPYEDKAISSHKSSVNYYHTSQYQYTKCSIFHVSKQWYGCYSASVWKTYTLWWCSLLLISFTPPPPPPPAKDIYI